MPKDLYCLRENKNSFANFISSPVKKEVPPNVCIYIVNLALVSTCFRVVHTNVHIKIRVLSQCGKCYCCVFGFMRIYTVIVLFEKSVHIVESSLFYNTRIKVVYAVYIA